MIRRLVKGGIHTYLWKLFDVFRDPDSSVSCKYSHRETIIKLNQTREVKRRIMMRPR